MTSNPTTKRVSQLSRYAAALSSFTSSPSAFRILHSVPSLPRSVPSTLPQPPKNLYILDSSFNPPTLAHLRLATSALLEDSHPSTPKRLLLLLATQNADKAPKPAAYEQRLAMMEIFATELLAKVKKSQQEGGGGEVEGVDIALTTHPYFVDKSNAISSSGSYPPETTQIHLTGYDTLIRILDPKYYPPSHNLSSLHLFLERHRLRVAYRTDDSWGEREAQDKYLREIGEGKREGEGARREWVEEGRVVLVEGRKEGEEVVSSTKVREAVRKGDKDALGRLVPEGVGEWILGEGLYLDE